MLSQQIRFVHVNRINNACLCDIIPDWFYQIGINYDLMAALYEYVCSWKRDRGEGEGGRMKEGGVSGGGMRGGGKGRGNRCSLPIIGARRWR